MISETTLLALSLANGYLRLTILDLAATFTKQQSNFMILITTPQLLFSSMRDVRVLLLLTECVRTTLLVILLTLNSTSKTPLVGLTFSILL